MLPIALLALEILEDPTAAGSAKAVACSTILAALEQGLDVPAGSHMGCWRYLLSSDCSAVVLHRHELAHPEVARDAIRVLIDRDTGEAERDLALAAIRGANVEHVVPEDLLTIIGHVLDEGRARQVGHLINRVHEERGLSSEFLVAVRDKLAASPASAIRAAAVEIGGLLPRLDETFVHRMFLDDSPAVRVAVADHLEKAEPLDIPRALLLVRDRMKLEQHRSVVSVLHYAVGSLVRSAGRRVRQWDSSTRGTGN